MTAENVFHFLLVRLYNKKRQKGTQYAGNGIGCLDTATNPGVDWSEKVHNQDHNARQLKSQRCQTQDGHHFHNLARLLHHLTVKFGQRAAFAVLFQL